MTTKIEKTPKSKVSFLDLDIYCLESIFKFCDPETLTSLSEVCEKFNDIMQRISFSKCHRFDCNIYSDTEINAMAKTIQNIGPYLVQLKLKISCNFETNKYLPFFSLLGQCIGDNIRSLSFRSPLIPKQYLDALKPVLGRIESLKIVTENESVDDQYDMDLHSLCPNLIDLHIQVDMFFEANAKKWPKLEKLKLGDNEFMTDNTFRLFMQNNPQLKYLKVAAFNADLHLCDVTTKLPNLESLVIFQDDSDLSPENVLLLQNLKHLTELTLMRVNTDNLDELLKNLLPLKRLEVLLIQANYESSCDDNIVHPKPEWITALGQELQQLKRFHISYCQLSYATVIEFIRAAKNLKELHLHHCEIVIDEKLVRDIVCERKLLANDTTIPQLRIFGDQYCDDPTEMLLANSDVMRYLKFNTCYDCDVTNLRFFEAS